jgi:monothiol glutaredoxin
MKPPKITAYLKPACGWSQGVRAIMRKYKLAYEDCDVINNPSIYEEMVQKSEQGLSPCVEIDGHMLADVSGDEVEAYLLKAGRVQPTVVVADAPTNQACDAHHHE